MWFDGKHTCGNGEAGGACLTGVLRKTVFCLSKGHLLRRNLPSFRSQKTVFCKAVANLLDIKML